MGLRASQREWWEAGRKENRGGRGKRGDGTRKIGRGRGAGTKKRGGRGSNGGGKLNRTGRWRARDERRMIGGEHEGGKEGGRKNKRETRERKSRGWNRRGKERE